MTDTETTEKESVVQKAAEEYQREYDEGYGLQYPDGHIIRFHRHILEPEVGMKEGKILDYGCGSGIHAHYFSQHGFAAYGCDTSETAIDSCKSLMPEYSENFYVIPPEPDIENYFNEEFDLIISNQVLYFLTDEQVEKLLHSLYDLLREGGVVLFTWISPDNYYNDNVVETKGEMSRVVLSGRVDLDFWVNFKTQDELMKLFSDFEKLHMGWYGAVIREDEGDTTHNMFVGKKT